MINFEEARVFDLAQDEVLLNGLSTSTKTLDVRNCRGTRRALFANDGPQIRRRPITVIGIASFAPGMAAHFLK
jgi:hypothetical protein